MEKLLCCPGILFFYHFYRTILSEIERENERNILDYWAIFCPYYVIFFSLPFFLVFFFLFSFSYHTIFCLYCTIFWFLQHYLPGILDPEDPKLFPCTMLALFHCLIFMEIFSELCTSQINKS